MVGAFLTAAILRFHEFPAMLQSGMDAVLNLSAFLAPVNTALLVGLAFRAGRTIEKVDDTHHRLSMIESRCLQKKECFRAEE